MEKSCHYIFRSPRSKCALSITVQGDNPNVWFQPPNVWTVPCSLNLSLSLWSSSSSTVSTAIFYSSWQSLSTAIFHAAQSSVFRSPLHGILNLFIKTFVSHTNLPNVSTVHTVHYAPTHVRSLVYQLNLSWTQITLSHTETPPFIFIRHVYSFFHFLKTTALITA